jgi:uncharacterized protein
MSSISGTGLEVILSGFLGATMAQSFKLIRNGLRGEPFNFRVLVETGGMPSSHSSAMTAMAFSVGWVSGFDSVIFSVALGISFIVMYDAAGVRRAAGRMAGILNNITEDLYTHHPDKLPERLRELLGHTPFEVLIGALVGILTATLVHKYVVYLI